LAPHLRANWPKLPTRLANQFMHLDPDFTHLTYGDCRQRAQQIRSRLGAGDLIVFYGGMKDINPTPRLIYGIIGLYVIEEIVSASSVPASRWPENAHTRRMRARDNDIVVRASPGVSGRLDRCLDIGEFRDRAYRVRRNLLTTWGGLSVSDGYLQRSARLPAFNNADRFYAWFCNQGVRLIPRNN
jgi:hypothetical protein